MELWWSELGTALRVFYTIAIATTFALLLQMIALLFGFGDEGDADLDDADADAGTHLLSMRTVTGFFTGFGWAGVASLEAGWSLPASVAVATLVGAAFMAAVFALMRMIYGLRYSGTIDYRNAVGEIGNVYLKVPAAMAGPGQVEVTVQGRLRVVSAFTNAGQDLTREVRVKVIDVMDNNTLVVEPLAAPAAAGKGDS